jgi:hypothetical protein
MDEGAVPCEGAFAVRRSSVTSMARPFERDNTTRGR